MSNSINQSSSNSFLPQSQGKRVKDSMNNYYSSSKKVRTSTSKQKKKVSKSKKNSQQGQSLEKLAKNQDVQQYKQSPQDFAGYIRKMSAPMRKSKQNKYSDVNQKNNYTIQNDRNEGYIHDQNNYGRKTVSSSVSPLKQQSQQRQNQNQNQNMIQNQIDMQIPNNNNENLDNSGNYYPNSNGNSNQQNNNHYKAKSVQYQMPTQNQNYQQQKYHQQKMLEDDYIKQQNKLQTQIQEQNITFETNTENTNQNEQNFLTQESNHKQQQQQQQQQIQQFDQSQQNQSSQQNQYTFNNINNNTNTINNNTNQMNNDQDQQIQVDDQQQKKEINKPNLPLFDGIKDTQDYKQNQEYIDYDFYQKQAEQFDSKIPDTDYSNNEEEILKKQESDLVQQEVNNFKNLVNIDHLQQTNQLTERDLSDITKFIWEKQINTNEKFVSIIKLAYNTIAAATNTGQVHLFLISTTRKQDGSITNIQIYDKMQFKAHDSMGHIRVCENNNLFFTAGDQSSVKLWWYKQRKEVKELLTINNLHKEQIRNFLILEEVEKRGFQQIIFLTNSQEPNIKIWQLSYQSIDDEQDFKYNSVSSLLQEIDTEGQVITQIVQKELNYLYGISKNCILTCVFESDFQKGEKQILESTEEDSDEFFQNFSVINDNMIILTTTGTIYIYEVYDFQEMAKIPILPFYFPQLENSHYIKDIQVQNEKKENIILTIENKNNMNASAITNKSNNNDTNISNLNNRESSLLVFFNLKDQRVLYLSYNHHPTLQEALYFHNSQIMQNSGAYSPTNYKNYNKNNPNESIPKDMQGDKYLLTIENKNTLRLWQDMSKEFDYGENDNQQNNDFSKSQSQSQLQQQQLQQQDEQIQQQSIDQQSHQQITETSNQEYSDSDPFSQHIQKYSQQQQGYFQNNEQQFYDDQQMIVENFDEEEEEEDEVL